MPESRTTSHVMVGGGRLPLKDTARERVPLPMTYMQGSLTRGERAILWRWVDGKQLSEGNIAAVMSEGQPCGRYAAFADKGVSMDDYVSYEADAYRWIGRRFLQGAVASQAEYFARMMAETVDRNFLDWGGLVANSDDPLISLGAAIGSTRSLAWYLEQGYAFFAEFWRQRVEAHKAGREPTNEFGRLRSVLAAVQGHRARQIAGRGKS